MLARVVGASAVVKARQPSRGEGCGQGVAALGAVTAAVKGLPPLARRGRRSMGFPPSPRRGWRSRGCRARRREGGGQGLPPSARRGRRCPMSSCIQAAGAVLNRDIRALAQRGFCSTVSGLRSSGGCHGDRENLGGRRAPAVGANKLFGGPDGAHHSHWGTSVGELGRNRWRRVADLKHPFYVCERPQSSLISA